MPSKPRMKPPPPPLEINLIWVGTIGATLCAIAALGLVVFGSHWLADHDRRWWIGTAITGAAIGAAGALFCYLNRSLPEGVRGRRG